MYLLKRTSTSPSGPIKILVDEQVAGDTDAGLAVGGSFEFWPPGSDEGESQFQVGDHAARQIMGDPELAKHFDCSPPLGKEEPDRSSGHQENAKSVRGQILPADDK